MKTRKALLGAALFLLPVRAHAADVPKALERPPQQGDTASTPPGGLAELGIEDLMKIQVTTASRHPQPLSTVPAAIYVITAEEIRRSGLTSVPELLRLVPGLEVAQIDADRWAITARGFNGTNSNKLLVLVDGRSVYLTLFSGVFWDEHDLLLEDIERIEVIRGPGGSLWGANAVNGVINIITKSADETQGNLLLASAGNQEEGPVSVQHGGTVGNHGAYRVFGNYTKRDDLVDVSGARAPDGGDSRRGGFRFDGQPSPSDQIMVQGDFHDNHLGRRGVIPTLTPPYAQVADERFPASGWDVVARWNRERVNGANTRLQVYYDRTNRAQPDLRIKADTWDLDFQHRLAPLGRHRLTAGLGYRRTSDDTRGTQISSLDPPHRADNLFSAFIHDEVALANHVQLTLGSKFEHNDYTGFEVQPNIRLAWTPDERRTLWAAISRAIREANRTDQDFRFLLATIPPGTPDNPGPLPAAVTLVGDPRFRSESVLAYELGYRFRPSDRVFIDVASFYNVYKGLQTNEPGMPFVSPGPPPHVVTPFLFANGRVGETYGVEIAARWTVRNYWRLSLGYTQLQYSLSNPQTPIRPEIESPHQQIQLSSYLDLPHQLEFDTSLYAVSRVADPNFIVPGYTRVDVRLGWRPSETVEVSLAAQNLFSPRHQEFLATGIGVPSQVERSFYGKVTLRFR